MILVKIIAFCGFMLGIELIVWLFFLEVEGILRWIF